MCWAEKITNVSYQSVCVYNAAFPLADWLLFPLGDFMQALVADHTPAAASVSTWNHLKSSC